MYGVGAGVTDGHSAPKILQFLGGELPLTQLLCEASSAQSYVFLSVWEALATPSDWPKVIKDA